ncbi:MAG: hypothetical protein ACQESX_00325, partial [Bacteroidota bacterium]
MGTREIILLLAAIIGLIIELRKLHVTFTIIATGMLAGITLWAIGIETVETSIYFGFVLLAFLVAIFQRGIELSNRLVIGTISAFVFAAEVAAFMRFPLDEYVFYLMAIPVFLYLRALYGKPVIKTGMGCITVMAVDAAYFFIDAV